MADFFAFLTSQLSLTFDLFLEGDFFYGVFAVGIMLFAYGLAAITIDKVFRSIFTHGFFIGAPLLALASFISLAVTGSPLDELKNAFYAIALLLVMMTVAGLPCIKLSRKLLHYYATIATFLSLIAVKGASPLVRARSKTPRAPLMSLETTLP